MVPMSAMSQEIEAVVRSALADLVRVKRVNGGFFVNLPMLYPDGSCVTIRIDQIASGLRVSDNGFAYREADDVGHARSFRRTARSVAESKAVEVSDRMIYSDVSQEELFGAICEVAEVSWRVADHICERAFDEDEVVLSEELNDKLVKLFGEPNVSIDTQLLGASTTEWKVSSIVNSGGHKTVFQAVTPFANSIYKASTAFRDLAALDTPPKLIAVVRSKAALGNKLALLAPSRILEQSQADESFFKAAA